MLVVSKALLLRIFLSGILLTLADIVTDLYNGSNREISNPETSPNRQSCFLHCIQFFSNCAVELVMIGQTKWGVLSLSFIWLPGVFMFIWLLDSYRRGGLSAKKFAKGAILSGPLFPLWVLGSYIRASLYKEEPKKFINQFVYSVFFKALEGFVEAAPQLLLNCYITLMRWELSIPQLAAMIISVISLTKTATENHFVEMRVKVPETKKVVTASFFFLAHIVFRILIYGTLLTYLGMFLLPLVITLITLNWIGARITLAPLHLSCTFWTAVSSPFSCSCFKHIDNEVAKGPGLLELPQVLSFYLWNTIITNCSLLMIFSVLVALLRTGKYVPAYNGQYVYPIFSCQNNETVLKYDIPRYKPLNKTAEFICRICVDGEEEHQVLTYYVLPVSIIIGFLILFWTFYLWFIARSNSKHVEAEIEDSTTGEIQVITAVVSDKPTWLASGPGWRKEWKRHNVEEMALENTSF